MSTPAQKPSPSSGTPSDGLGYRVLGFDKKSGDRLEMLRLRPQFSSLPAFEAALREQAKRLDGFRHSSFARVRQIDRLANQAAGIAIVSNHLEGHRLADLLNTAEHHQVRVDVDTTLCLLRQLMGSLAALHATGDVSHGALTPDRILVTPDARLVVTEYVLAPALETLQWSREKLWQDAKVLLPASAEPARLDHQSDLMQAGFLALSLLVGRSLYGERQYPLPLADLAKQAKEQSVTVNGTPKPLSPALSTWLLRMLQVHPDGGFKTMSDAQAALEIVVADGYLAAPAAVEAFLQRCAAAAPADGDAKDSAPVPITAPQSHLAAAATAAADKIAAERASADKPAAPRPVAAPPPATSAAATPSRPVAAAAPAPPRPVAVPPKPAATPQPSSATPVAAKPAAVPPPAAKPSAPSTAPQPHLAAAAAAAAEKAATPITAAKPATTPPVAAKPAGASSTSSTGPTAVPASKPTPVPALTPVAAKADPKPDAVKPAAAAASASAASTPDLVRDSSLFSDQEIEQPKSRGKALVFAVIGVAALAAIGFGVMRYLNTGGTPAQASPDVAATSQGTISIDAAPKQAIVFIDEQQRGTTPLRVDLPAGPHTVKLEAEGGLTRTFDVTINAGKEVSHLVELTAKTGSLEVRSEPANGRVSLDGKHVGNTPTTIPDLQPGDHTLVVEGPQNTVRQTVKITAGVPASVLVPLSATPAAPQAGWLAVASTDELQVLENGEVVGSSRQEQILMQAGSHDLEFTHEGSGFTTTRRVTIAPGKVQRLTIALPDGTLSVNATPWAEVLMDGQKIGDTPIGNLTVRAGSHELIFRHPKLGERRQSIVVRPGQPTRVTVDLSK